MMPDACPDIAILKDGFFEKKKKKSKFNSKTANTHANIIRRILPLIWSYTTKN